MSEPHHCLVYCLYLLPLQGKQVLARVVFVVLHFFFFNEIVIYKSRYGFTHKVAITMSYQCLLSCLVCNIMAYFFQFLFFKQD